MKSLNLREKGQLASRTLSHLPYFHGIMDEVRASGKLHKGGDFLVFLNKTKNKTVTLALRTINKEVLHLPITAAADGHFIIEGANQDKHYFNIDSLIKFHLENGVFISKTRATYFMKHACLNRLLQEEYTTTRRCDINYLKYYAGCVNDCDLSKWLANDGDYLLRFVEDDKVLQLCVFWNNCICVLKNTFRPTARRFILPRGMQQEPWESVNSIDHFLKSVVRGGFLLEGVQLRQAADINKSWSDGVNTLNVSGNVVAKLPLHKQPYYHGIASSVDIENRLTCSGQFCVFLEKAANVLLLAVRCESSTLWYSIKADGVGKVWLRDYSKFGTVEELIDHYLTHGLPGMVRFLNSKRYFTFSQCLIVESYKQYIY
ncbi:hypothetical protein D918_03844 [Trichuris suis]|nr:hypothetical protein D918_03844 [Trichuris suis]